MIVSLYKGVLGGWTPGGYGDKIQCVYNTEATPQYTYRLRKDETERKDN